MQNAEIDGLVSNLVVNGVEVMSYVEAELDRRHPVRLLIRSTDPAALREGWRQLHDGWETTADRVRTMPAGSEDQRVDGEWSMVETLRHLVFVHDLWFRGCALGIAGPFNFIGLPTMYEPAHIELGIEPAARPSLDEVLAVRARQASEIEGWLGEVVPELLAQTAPLPVGVGWQPYAKNRTVAACLHVLLDEEWAHHGFCTRDLDKLAETQTS